jgi:copper chaperone CopZ
MNNKKQLLTSLSLLFSFFLLTASTAYSGEIKRTSLLVSNLSCTSCLASIEDGLMGLPGVLGMDGDVRTGLVIVDHEPDVAGETIAGIITSMGYPAKVDWTADMDKRQALIFSAKSRFASSGCGGGCSSKSADTAGPRVWNSEAAQSGKVIRTTMQVAQLSCTSCLANIEAELKNMPGTVGMIGDVRQGLVAIDHLESLPGERIAEAITKIGYPATIIGNGNVPAQRIKSTAVQTTPVASRISSTNCNSRNCNATATAWKQLYQKYLANTSAK